MLFPPWYISQYFPGVDLWQAKLSAIERREFKLFIHTTYLTAFANIMDHFQVRGGAICTNSRVYKASVTIVKSKSEGRDHNLSKYGKGVSTSNFVIRFSILHPLGQTIIVMKSFFYPLKPSSGRQTWFLWPVCTMNQVHSTPIVPPMIKAVVKKDKRHSYCHPLKNCAHGVHILSFLIFEAPTVAW